MFHHDILLFSYWSKGFSLVVTSGWPLGSDQFTTHSCETCSKTNESQKYLFNHLYSKSPKCALNAFLDDKTDS